MPLNTSTVTTTVDNSGGTLNTIFRRANGTTWLSWLEVVNAVNGPITDTDRTYYTGSGVPKVAIGTGAGVIYNLAVPSPVAALTISVDGSSGPIDSASSEAVYYSYTYVTSFGEESQPAPLSNALVCSSLQLIRISGYVAAPAGRSINRYRFYRSQTDTTGTTTLFYIAEAVIALFPSPFVHSLAVNPLAEGLPSLNWNQPIATLSGLCAGPNGMLAAFSGKDLYFCEPFYPHAWPVKYSVSMDFPIVGIASIGSAFIVLTTGTPYLMQGTHPATMVQTKIEQNFPCLSARSIVDLGYSVVYASTQGLVKITNEGAQLVTEAMFTRQQWLDQNAETVIASQHFGRYIYTHLDNLGARQGKIIDLTGSQPFLIEHDQTFTAAYFAQGSGTLFILLNGNKVSEWDSETGTALTMRWKSRLVHMPSPINFGCVLMETDVYDGSGAGVMNVYADGVLVRAVTDRNKASRLPSGFLALRWEVEFVGTIKITSLNIASAPDELAAL